MWHNQIKNVTAFLLKEIGKNVVYELSPQTTSGELLNARSANIKMKREKNE